MKAIGSPVEWKEMAFTLGLMAESMMVNGLMINLKEKEFLFNQI